MIRKFILALITMAFLATTLVACTTPEKSTIKIGVSFGVGSAKRWDEEKDAMERHAREVGAEIEVRLNRTDEPKTQFVDCKEMLDGGIDVLIFTPRDTNNIKEIVDYAKKKNVPVISYSRLGLGEEMDLFVGYDSEQIGQKQGQYISEMAFEGDYIILRGDAKDSNAVSLYLGAMRYIELIRSDINIIADVSVDGWSPEKAKEIVREAIVKNGNKVDAILAPNDTLAGASIEVLEELGVTEKVVVTGLDADLEAIRRIVDGKQSMTVYADSEELAIRAINSAVSIAKGETVEINGEFDNKSGTLIPSNLISGKTIVKENVDKIIIGEGVYSKDEVYSER